MKSDQEFPEFDTSYNGGWGLKSSYVVGNSHYNNDEVKHGDSIRINVDC